MRCEGDYRKRRKITPPTPWTGFQSPSAPQECRLRKHPVESCPKTCRSVLPLLFYSPLFFPFHYCFTCVTLRQLQMCPTEDSLKGYPLKLDLTLGIGRVILVYGIRPDTPETCMYSTSPTARREIRYCKDTHPRERAESLRSVSSPKEKTQGTYRR